MCTLCGADCSACPMRTRCKGCAETDGHPFGGSCVAAEFIKLHGADAYAAFKTGLCEEFNALNIAGLPRVENLFELSGRYVNLSYPLPGGESCRFLDDNDVYLGCQLPCEGVCPENAGKYFGLIAGNTFLLVSRYGENGSDPELIAFRKR